MSVNKVFDEQLADAVRVFMRDSTKDNKIIQAAEHTPTQREFALNHSLDWINAIPPLTAFTTSTIPFRSWLVEVATLKLLESLMLKLERNDVLISDTGGVSVQRTQLDRITRRIAIERQTLRGDIQQGKAGYAMKQACGQASGVSSVYGEEYGLDD